MPRKPRFYQPGLPVHAFQRGHNKQPVFFEDEDYLVYLRLLKESAEACGCVIHAYVLMNPVRAGMVDHPAKYRWSSYASNALGVDNSIIQLHEQYLALSTKPQDRQTAYCSLFAIKTDAEELDMIRASLYSGTPLGNECFKKKIEVMTGCKVGVIKPGRPVMVKTSEIGYTS